MQCWISKHLPITPSWYKAAGRASQLTLTAMFIVRMSLLLSSLCLVSSAPFEEALGNFNLGDILGFRGSEEGGDVGSLLTASDGVETSEL